MRILITNTGPWGTGSGTVADGVMKELKRRGHIVKAFFPDCGFPGADNEKYYGDTDTYHIVKFPTTYQGTHLYTFPLIIPDPNPRNYLDAWTFKELSKEQLEKYFGYMSEELKHVIEDFDPDVIECQHIWALDKLVKELGRRYICVAHHSDQLGFLYDERMRELATNSAQNADYIFAISNYVREEVLSLYGVQPEKVIITENGYDHSIFRPIKDLNRDHALSALGVDEGLQYPIISFCGKISHTKGVDILLKANRFIQNEKKIYLLIAGSGSLENFSEEERQEFCMENVIFLGHRSQKDLALLHNISALSVLPSRNEGFGIAALEAMGCGKPIVVTNVGGMPSFAVGRVVEKENEIELAEAILGLLNLDVNEYHSLCQLSLETALYYSWERIVDIREKYYQKVFSKNMQSNLKTCPPISLELKNIT